MPIESMIKAEFPRLELTNKVDTRHLKQIEVANPFRIGLKVIDMVEENKGVVDIESEVSLSLDLE